MLCRITEQSLYSYCLKMHTVYLSHQLTPHFLPQITAFPYFHVFAPKGSLCKYTCASLFTQKVAPHTFFFLCCLFSFKICILEIFHILQKPNIMPAL